MKNWTKNPSKNQLILIILISLIGNLMLITAMTNLFTESMLNGKYLILYFLMLGSIFTTVKVYFNYFNRLRSEV